MHADRTSRLMLTLVGLLALAAGGGAMAASTGVFGAAFSRRTLLDNLAGRYIGHHGGWLWPAVAGACLLLALACLRWILALLASTDRVGAITIPGDTDQGTTILQPAAGLLITQRSRVQIPPPLPNQQVRGLFRSRKRPSCYDLLTGLLTALRPSDFPPFSPCPQNSWPAATAWPPASAYGLVAAMACRVLCQRGRLVREQLGSPRVHAIAGRWAQERLSPETHAGVLSAVTSREDQAQRAGSARPDRAGLDTSRAASQHQTRSPWPR